MSNYRKTAYFLILAAAAAAAALFIFWRISELGQERQAAGADPVSAVGFLCGSRDSSEMVSITNDSYEGYWDVYLPAAIADEPVHLVCSKAFSIRIDGREYHNGDILPVEKAGEEISAELINHYGETRKGTLRFYEAEGLPCVFLLTMNEDGEAVMAEKKGNKEPGQIVTALADGTIDQRASAGLKVHGNTTFFEEKKSYNVNLTEAVSILGMPAQRKWCLIANTADPSHLENAMMQTIAARLGEPFCPEWRFVNVFVNGQYKGLYTLFQKIDISGGTIDITNLESENKNMKEGHDPEDITGGYMLELMTERTWENANVRIETPHRWIKVKSPNNATESELNYIATLAGQAEKILYSDTAIESAGAEDNHAKGTNSKAVRAEGSQDLTQYFNLDSWAIQYLLQEISSNCDAEVGSQFCYVDKDSQTFYGGPAWDFDRSFWIPTSNEGLTYVIRHLHVAGLHDDTKPGVYDDTGTVKGEENEAALWQNRLWLQQLDTWPDFHERLKELYLDQADQIIAQMVKEDIPAWRAQIQTSVLADSIRWNKDYDAALSYQDRVTEALSGRREFLTDYYSNEAQYVIVRFRLNFGRYDLLVPVKRGESIGEDVMPYVNGSQEWHTADGKDFTSETVVEDNITVYSSGDEN